MIHIQHLDFHYKKKMKLYDQLDLDLKSGHIYGLLGKNGSGKSTLFKLLTGLIFPKNGNIEVLGYDPTGRHPALLQQVFYVPEEFDIPEGTISQFPQIYGGFYPNFDYSKFRALINQAELNLSQNTTQLSYGQKKKVLIAFGIATNTKLLLMDEPTNGLDILSKSIFRKMIAEALLDDRTIIISTHQVRDLERLIDAVVIIDEGQVLFHKEMEEISEKMNVTLEGSVPESNDGIIYCQQIPGGYSVVRQGKSEDSQDIDLELLFNTVVREPLKIKALF